MKKQILISLILLSAIWSMNAQWSGTSPIYTNSNVGIGTTTITSPLTISKPTWHLVPTFEIIHIPENPGCAGCVNIGQKISVLDDQGTGKRNIGLWVSAKNALNNYAAVFESGNVGIGVTNPGWQLTVKDIITLNGSASQRLHIRPNSGYAGFIYWAEAGVAERGILGFNAGSGDLVYRSGATGFNNGTERFRITSSGRVGIGTSTPSADLTVNSKILAREVEVVSSISSDYVFEPDYQLMPLTELELYLKRNKHLPGIPSAEEFSKTGQNLAKTDDMLLRKIEELTLYILNQKRIIDKQQAEIDDLKKEFEKFRLDVQK